MGLKRIEEDSYETPEVSCRVLPRDCGRQQSEYERDWIACCVPREVRNIVCRAEGVGDFDHRKGKEIEISISMQIVEL